MKHFTFNFKWLVMSLLLCIGSSAWATDIVAYTLTPTTNSASASSAYDQGYDFNINSITWNVTGNTNMNPWRIGGKKSTINSTTGTGDRILYSKGTISDNISKIEIIHGNSASDITVNSITLIVSTGENGGGTVISTLTGSYTNNKTTTFSRPNDKDWTGRYYKIVYNVTNTTTTQKYVLFSEAKFYKEDGGSSSPSISADDVNIAYDATNGSIAYTLANATGNVSAVVTSGDWLTLGTITASEVPFTCSANTSTTDRTATVTLSFTGASDKVVTVTQAAAPNNISDITAASTAYTVIGTVVATNNRGFVTGDGTGYVYTYLNEAPSQSIGDKVKIAGTTGTYGQIIQFTSGATITTESTSAYDGTPDATVINAVPDYSTGLHLSTYLQFEGELEESNDNYYITVGSDQIQISYPTTAQTTALSALDGKTVRVKGYFSGNNSSGYFSVMLESVEEVTNPTLSINPTSAQAFTYVVGNGPSDDQMFTITGANLTSADITATVSSDYEITDNTDYSSSVTIASGDIVSVRLKAGLAKGAHNGTLTLSSTGATNVVVNLSGTVTGQTYAIEQYTAPATAHGTITFAPTSPIEEGAEVTLSAEAAEGYTFTANSWVIYKQSGEDYVVDNSITVTENKFNMPAYAVWVDGTFAAKPTYAITCVADPVAGGTILSDANAYEGKTVTISYETATGYELSGIVITKTSDGSATGITLTKSGDDYTFTMPAYAVTATATFARCFTWNLSAASYASATTSLVTWSNTYATMTNAKGSSSNDANNYLGGNSNTQTRFYKDHILKFAPATGWEISKVEISAVTSYVAGFTGNTWTNASASANGTKVTVTPTDGNKDFYVTISAACRATAVKVYYQASTIPYITASDVNIACDATNGSVAYTVNNPKDGGALTAELTTGNWLELGAVSTSVPFTTTTNNSKVDRTATVTLTYTYDTNKTTTKVVTITQAGDPNSKDAPTITVPDEDVEIAFGSTYTVDDSGITGGAITVTSGNTSVATVDGLVITPVAAGTVEITVSTEEDDTYAAGSETFILTVLKPAGKNSVALFYESFSTSTGGPLSTWGGSEANGTIKTDNTGWSLTSGSGAGGCAKFGTGSANGSATTPSITVENGETYALSFNAAPWSDATNETITVTVTGGTINNNATATTATMKKQQWNEFDFQIVATSTSLTIEFDCSADRFFLDEVKIDKVGAVHTANVTLNKYGYATYCSENPINFSNTTGYTAWRVSSIDDSGNITFTKITEKIKGGQGVLLYNINADGVNTSNATITFADGDVEFTSSENLLVGTTSPVNVAAGEVYGLSGDKFVQSRTAGNIPAGKAYIEASSIPTSAKSFNFVFEDETTGISEMKTVVLDDDAWYDLQGRRVAQPTKGIYIHNGKKIFVK